MNISIVGNSGCTIELHDSFVRKISFSEEYNDRLIKQRDKQQRFSDEKLYSKIISTPPTWKSAVNEKKLAFFDMEICHGANYIDFLQTADPFVVNRIFLILKTYINKIIGESSWEEIPFEVYTEKYYQTKRKIKDRFPHDDHNLFELFEQSHFLNFSDKIRLPAGKCHGDLTFSNMLFNSDETITFIDFLDCYIESPLQDMAKIRQDTKYLWSTRFYRGNFDLKKIEIIMQSLDEKFSDFFDRFEFYSRYYTLFQFLNFMRILVYVKDGQLANTVKDWMKEIV